MKKKTGRLFCKGLILDEKKMGGFSQDLIWVSYRMIYSKFSSK
jgi:hypothetical protein